MCFGGYRLRHRLADCVFDRIREAAVLDEAPEPGHGFLLKAAHGLCLVDNVKFAHLFSSPHDVITAHVVVEKRRETETGCSRFGVLLSGKVGTPRLK